MATNDKIYTAVDGAIFEAELANAMQARSLLTPSNPTAISTATVDTSPVTKAEELGGDGLPIGPGAILRYGLTSVTGITSNKILVLDDTPDLDWRDRFLRIDYQVFDNVNYLAGGSDDDRFELQNVVPRPTVNGKLLYTGNGILNAGGSANPSEGGGSGLPDTTTGGGKFAKFLIDAVSDLILYVERNSPNRLCVYNQHATTTYWLAWTLVSISAELGKR